MDPGMLEVPEATKRGIPGRNTPGAMSVCVQHQTNTLLANSVAAVMTDRGSRHG
jgi:hypothetical protein